MGDSTVDRTSSSYLLALYAAERRYSPPIPPGYVADALDRSPSATTEMFQRLADRGLVSRRQYRGVTLTEDGRERAAELYEQYAILMRFFRDVLEVEDYEREALTLTGTISTTVTDRLAGTILPAEDGDPDPIDSSLLSPPTNRS